MVEKFSLSEAKNLLRKLHDEQTRDGWLVVELWEGVLMKSPQKLGSEVWNVYEQVCLASLDCQRLDVAEVCISALLSKFPDSIRVQRLVGMLLEAENRYVNAAKVYEDILKKDPANMFARKRMIAMLKAQMRIPESIEKLNEYLKLFMTDNEAWSELCDLYLSLHDYSNAAFCMEELIMSNPHNHLFFRKYADIKYTSGGAESLELARSYYAHAVKLCPGDVRALYGLLLCASNLSMFCGKGSVDRSLNGKCVKWAAGQISTQYKNQQSDEQLEATRVLESIDRLQDSFLSPLPPPA